MSWKVVLTDYAFRADSLVEQVQLHTGASLEVHQALSEDEVIAAVRDADAVLLERAPITRRVIAEMQRCRVIVRHGVGYDTIDVEACTEAGICACNVADYCTPEVADHTVAMLLALARSLLPLDAGVRAGKWESVREAGRNRRIEGQTLGILGFGKIGQAVARRAAGFGLRIVAFDPVIGADAMSAMGATKLALDELLRVSDFVSLHLPLSPSTRHLINEETLSLMKSTAFLVNTSRGGLVDQRALYSALAEKRLAGAGLDVLEEEPPAQDDPLLALQNVLLSPHAAFYSEDAAFELHRRMAEQVAAVFQGRVPANLLNPAVLPRARYPMS
jgi:D-3-phosphoglycerate dehydrogenase / 2-oxoglutarate reductase